MKKTLFAISAIAVLLGFTACTSENETLEPQVSGKTILKAYTEEATRTALSGDDETGYKVVWSFGDRITVGGKPFVLKAEGGGVGTTSGTFEGDELTDGDYTAYYPADYDGTNWPTAQTYEKTLSPMKATFTYATGEEPSLAFKNEGGILRLNLKLKEGDAARSVKKIVLSCAQLADDIVLNCATAVELTKDGVPFHIAVPGTDEGTDYSGLKIVITDNTGGVCTKTLKSDKSITVKRSQITPVNLTASNFQEPNYLCFTAGEAGATVGMAVEGTVSSLPNIEYSTDLNSWKTFIPGTTDAITLTNVGDKVYFRGDNPDGFIKDFSNYVYFNITNNVAASGNVMSLVDPTCQATTIPCEGCFSYLFSGCSSLTSAPELPATTLAVGCYYYMFSDCSSLTSAPELPATTLADYCYYDMFSDCSSLTTAPALPATELKARCYQWMFCRCSNLTTAPELPATTLADYCYGGMFYYCTKLNSVTCLATDISATGCVNWLNSVAESGILYCAPDKVNMWKKI